MRSTWLLVSALSACTSEPRVTDGVLLMDDLPTPDGRIIFVSNRSGSAQIWIMDPGGTNPTQIGTIDPAVEITRVQMADTGLVAFRAGGDGIWLMEADGSNLRKLVT